MAKRASSRPLTKTQLIALLSEKCDLPKKKVSEFFDELLEVAYKEAKKEGFTFPGLGKLVVRKRKARMGRNPQTGEAIKIPAKKVLKFTISKTAKDAILPQKK